jgi:hypothetical protein
MRRSIFLAVAFFLISQLAMSTGGLAMQITTPAYQHQEQIPKKYVMPGAGGDNASVPFSWSEAPADAKSFALSMIDPHPVANNWIHWLVINIPADVTSLDEGASGSSMPAGAKELANSFGKPGYGGPQPPKGTGEHPYVTTVYALSVESLDLGDKASLDEFKSALEGKVLDQAEVTGVFEQK